MATKLRCKTVINLVAADGIRLTLDYPQGADVVNVVCDLLAYSQLDAEKTRTAVLAVLDKKLAEEVA